MVSIAIGNGLTDPLVQYEFYADMACDTKYGPILPEEKCDEMRSKYPTCRSLISSCYAYKSPFTCVPGSFYCNSAMIQVSWFCIFNIVAAFFLSLIGFVYYV